MKNNFKKIKKILLTEKIFSTIQSKEILNELIIFTNKDKLIKIIEFLKNNEKCEFSILTDICAIDYPKNIKRFEIVYNMLSIKYNTRIRIKIKIKIKEKIPSITHIFKTAEWYEREIWDLYGISFKGNKNLKRILTDYSFIGHPMLKDFPLSGHQEIKYDKKQKKIIYKNIRKLK